MRKAYSLLTVKNLDESARVITGIATTPTADRMRDIVEPLGAKFTTPMSLLLHHDAKLPVGSMDFATPKKTGIPFKASLPNVVEAGVVQDRVNEAWHSVKYRLIAAVSIGFQPIMDAIEQLKNGGLRFKEWEWLELSLVTIPANPDAVIQSFKSMDPNRIRSALHIPSNEIDPAAVSGVVRRVGSVRLITPGVPGKDDNAPRRRGISLKTPE